MEKTFVRHMTWGKQVKSSTGVIYKLVESMDESKESVKAVSMDNWGRYDLLKAWVRNWEQNSMGFRERFTENIEDCRTEMQSYEEEVKIADIVPHDIIRFITPNYQTKFEVKKLTKVLVNGKAATVAYMDECHFTFADTIGMNLYGGCFHICQFAELCEKNGIEVNPIENE